MKTKIQQSLSEKQCFCCDHGCVSIWGIHVCSFYCPFDLVHVPFVAALFTHACVHTHTHTSTRKHTHALVCAHMHAHKDFKLFCFYCFIYPFFHIKGKQHSMWNSPVNVHNHFIYTEQLDQTVSFFTWQWIIQLWQCKQSVDNFRLTVTPLPHTRMHTHTHSCTHTHTHTHTHISTHTHMSSCTYTHTNMHTYQSNKQKKRETTSHIRPQYFDQICLPQGLSFNDGYTHTYTHACTNMHTHTHTHTQHTISQPPPSLLWHTHTQTHNLSAPPSLLWYPPPPPPQVIIW